MRRLLTSAAIINNNSLIGQYGSIIGMLVLV